MFDLPSKCARCGTSLKKMVIGSNNFYYCRKCGCMSSVASASVSIQIEVREVVNV